MCSQHIPNSNWLNPISFALKLISYPHKSIKCSSPKEKTTIYLFWKRSIVWLNFTKMDKSKMPIGKEMKKMFGGGSNWQFDSRPLKVRNRPLPDLRIESAIRRWKDFAEGYKFGLDLVAIRLRNRELWAPKVPELHPGQFRDNFGTPTRESREKVTFGRGSRGVS
jgi:hypothetical protein